MAYFSETPKSSQTQCVSCRQMAQLLQNADSCNFAKTYFFINKQQWTGPGPILSAATDRGAYTWLCRTKTQSAASCPSLSHIPDQWSLAQKFLIPWNGMKPRLQGETCSLGGRDISKWKGRDDPALISCSLGVFWTCTDTQSGKGKKNKKHTRVPDCLLVHIFPVLPQYCTHVTSLFSTQLNACIKRQAYAVDQHRQQQHSIHVRKARSLLLLLLLESDHPLESGPWRLPRAAATHPPPRFRWSTRVWSIRGSASTHGGGKQRCLSSATFLWTAVPCRATQRSRVKEEMALWSPGLDTVSCPRSARRAGLPPPPLLLQQRQRPPLQHRRSPWRTRLCWVAVGAALGRFPQQPRPLRTWRWTHSRLRQSALLSPRCLPRPEADCRPTLRESFLPPIPDSPPKTTAWRVDR